MKELIDLYFAFLRIGLVNFGGGYAMLPLLERDLADKRGWVTVDELMDYFAIGQCTPGLIALNVATFIGNKRKGVAGGIIATLGFLTCPIVIILIIAMFLTNFADLPVVKNAFAGIRVCVCVLILQAVLKLWKKSVVDVTTLLLYLIIFLLMVFSSRYPYLRLLWSLRRACSAFSSEKGVKIHDLSSALLELFQDGSFFRWRRSGYPTVPL